MADGFNYWVSDDQLRTFASLPAARRLQWLEELRELTFKMATEKTRESWRRLRR